MKTLLMFVPLLATSSPIADGWVNLKLAYCCKAVYRQHRDWCWQTEKSGLAQEPAPTHLLVTRVIDNPVLIQAAVTQLVQHAQFSCDGEA